MTASMDVRDATYVTMELLSNWGNPANVGLSQVEFFDFHNQRIFVSPHDVDIRNADNAGDLCCLVNNNLNVRQLSAGCSNLSLQYSYNTLSKGFLFRNILNLTA